MIRKQNYMEEGLDTKRLFLVMLRKIWMILAATVAMSIVCGMIYEITVRMKYPEPIYQGEAEYHICFDESDEYEDVKNYYNAYTWNHSVLKSDPVVDVAMTVLPENISKEMIKQSVSGEMIGDIRFLTVKVTGTNKEVVEDIQKAYKTAMENFATVVGGITSIEMWRSEEIIQVRMDTYWKNALYLGGILGFCISFFVLLFMGIVDNRILVPSDLKHFSTLQVLGIRTKERDIEKFQKELTVNLEYVSQNGQKKFEQVMIQQEGIGYDTLRQTDGVILLLPFGKTNQKEVERALHQFSIQECHVVGCIIMDADARFIKQYY